MRQLGKHPVFMILPLLDRLPEPQSEAMKMQLAYDWVRRDPDSIEQILARLNLKPRNEEAVRGHIDRRDDTPAMSF